jgi:hypothetical protein
MNLWRAAMNNLCRLIITLIFTLFCLTSLHKQTYGANWLYILTNDGTKFYVDIDSIKVNRKAHTVKFWERHVYPTGSRTALNLYDYDEQSYICLFLTEYDSNGEVKFNGPISMEKRYVVPGTVFEKITSEVLKLKGIE